MKKSVVIAAYNGGKYIGEQLESILPQLEKDDEIIISDDFPSGDTKKAVDFYRDFDGRIIYVEGPGKGVIKNFENALKKADGDIVFLCDQDDVWLADKVKTVTDAFDGDLPQLVLHNAKVTDEKLNVTNESFFGLHGSGKGIVKNLLKNSYMGCCMAFTGSLKEKILPFPEDIPMHDQWIGLNAELYGKVTLIEQPLILYRRHGGNVTGGKTTFVQKLNWRKNMIKNLFFSKR